MENKMESTSEENYVISVPTSYVPNEKGLGYVYFEAMKKYKNDVAQYIGDTDEVDTYGELLERCIRVSLQLREKYNLNKDDIIMLCSDNHKNSCVPFIAGIFLGSQVCALDSTLSSLDITHFLKEVQPRILFIIPEVLEVIEESLTQAGVTTEIIIFGDSDKYEKFNEFLKPHQGEDTFMPVPVKSLEDPLVIVFSSGTTGLPKGIVINHFTLGAQTYNLTFRKSTQGVYLVYTTLFWASSVLFLSCSLVKGGARVLFKKFDPQEIWYTTEKYNVETIFLFPYQAILMLEAGRPESINTTSLKGLIISGAPISATHIKGLRKLLPGTLVFQGYGQSEVAGSVTTFLCNNAEEYFTLLNKENSVGKIIPGLSCKVVDVETESICRPYQQGEIRLKSRIMMNGYYKRDSSDAFDSDGWLKSGDLGYFDDEFCFYLVDRIKEMLTYKGWRIAPALLEMVLSDHPAIHQCVVIGMPHPDDGDLPMAIIVPLANYKNKITAEEIENLVADKAPDRMKLRGGVKFVDTLPMTPTGKVKRRELKYMVLNGLI